jgi:NAD(P)-dependent dehydrogenase (short-subunit alcohol dehydrogenase family)
MGKRLAGAVAFVSTGAAGAAGGGVGGINPELARRLAAEGATIIVVGSDAAEAAEAGRWVAELASDGAGRGRAAVYCAAGDAEADVDALIELAAELSR